MLDTIVLSLKEGMYIINEPDKFEPSARWVLDDKASLGGRGYATSKQNPTASELKNGHYKPRLTLTNRLNHAGNREAMLKIELSLPKLRFGNNFDELDMTDFEPTTELLIARLKEMGVLVFTQLLKHAPVSAIHYSKNIPLTDGSTPYSYIKKIKEANISLALDVNQTDYRNEGYSYKWHANSYEVAFYDKLKDLQQAKTSEKRAIEKDNALQLGLFDTPRKQSNFEVLRMEVRLNKRQKIGQLFKTLKIDKEITYESIFDPAISQKVLLYYLDTIEKQRPSILDYKPASPTAMLADLAIINKLTPIRAFQLLGLKQALDTINFRELRTMFGKTSDRSWYRLIAQTKAIKLPVTSSPFRVIREHLTDFKSLRLIDFQADMINNDKNTDYDN